MYTLSDCSGNIACEATSALFDYDVLASVVISSTSFMFVSLIFFVFEKFSTLKRFRAQPYKPNDGQLTNYEWWIAFRVSMRNLLVVQWPVTVLTSWYHRRVSGYGTSLSPMIVLFELAFCILFVEIWFYFSHRMLHRHWWFTRVHKQHHRFTYPSAICALHTHWFEFIFSNQLGVALGPVLIGCHLLHSRQPYLLSRTTDYKFDLDDLYTRIRARKPHFSTTHCARVVLDGKFIFQHAMVAHGCIMHNCEENVVIGGPMCAAHTAAVYNVTIRQTTLVDVDTSQRYRFTGLFTNRLFKKYEQIVPMLVAERIRADHLHSITTTPALDPYRINGTESALLYRSIGSLANTQLGARVFNDGVTPPYRRTNKASCNAVFRDMIVVAHRDIAEGEEIFVDYEGIRPRREFIGLSVTTVCNSPSAPPRAVASPRPTVARSTRSG